MNLKNQNNDYARLLGRMLDETPKSVLAAIIASYHMNRLGTDGDDIAGEVADEWRHLHAQGIVPQKPTAYAKSIMPDAAI